MSFINCPFSMPCGSAPPLCPNKQVTNCYENPPKRLVICRWSLVYLYYRQGNEVGSPHNKNKKVENRLDKLFPFLYNGNNEANNTVGSLQGSKVIQCRKSKSVSRSPRRSLALAERFRKSSRTQTVHSVFVLMSQDSLAGLR
jgi:hypothetical protein